MPNIYYNYNNDFIPFTKIRSLEIDDQFEAIEDGFDKIRDAFIGGIDSGSADTYVISTEDLEPEPRNLQPLTFKPLETNTGASTLVTNGGTVYAVVRGDGSPLVAGDIVADVPAFLIFDDPANRWVLIGAKGIAQLDLTDLGDGYTLVYNVSTETWEVTDLNDLPPGGTTDQALLKVDDTDYNVTWGDVSLPGHTHTHDDITDFDDEVNNLIDAADGLLPPGGTTDQVLTKIDNTDYNVEWADAASGGGGGGSPGTPHRYWRLETAGSTFFNAINLYADGEAFAGGKRWEEGTLVNSLATITADQSTTGASQTTASLLDGDPTNRPAPFNNERANYATSPTFDIDFGSEPQVLNNLQIAMSQGNLSSLTLSYSDDDSTYTEVGTISTIAAQTAESFSVPFVFLAQIDTIANDDLENFPDPNSGGGSALWTYVYTQQSSSFTAVVGNYYLNVDSGATITLPSSPSQGDFVGFRINPGGSAPISGGGLGNPSIVINGESSDDFSLGEGFNISSANGSNNDDTYPEYAGMVYVDATVGWAVIFGEVWVASA